MSFHSTVLSRNHSLFGQELTDKPAEQEEVRSFVAYPGIAFVPQQICSSEETLVEWVHDLWHELRHLEDILLTRFGMYQQTLFDIAEALGLYGLTLLAQGKSEDAQKNFRMSVQLVKKGICIHHEGVVAMEVMPTYSMIGPTVRKDTAGLISYLASKFEITKTLQSHRIERYVHEEGNLFFQAMQKPALKKMLKIRYEHEEAFRKGEEILKTFGEPGYLFAVPFLAMDIDLSPIDLIACSLDELETFFHASKESSSANLRLELLSSGGPSLYETMRAENRTSAMAERRRLYTHQLLPDFLREEMADKLKDSRSGEHIIELIKKEQQTIYWGENRFGHLFFILPYLSEPDERYAELVFSKSYSFEILLRYLTECRITRDYTNNFLLCLREEIANLSQRISDPYPFHRLIESFIKKVCAPHDRERYLPSES
jgi:hypothetical protein